MALNASELQKYFADMDKEEEEGAILAGVTSDEYRDAALPSTGPMAVGESLTPPSMMRPKTLASTAAANQPLQLLAETAGRAGQVAGGYLGAPTEYKKKPGGL